MLTLRIERKPGGFWLWLCRFAYRRIADMETSTIPVGIPGMRDPRTPCGAYAPRPRGKKDWGHCHTDGHYQCEDCAHIARCETCGLRINACECDQEGAPS